MVSGHDHAGCSRTRTGAGAAGQREDLGNHAKEIEDYIRSAEVLSMEDISVGVTHRPPRAAGAWRSRQRDRLEGGPARSLFGVWETTE